MGTPALVGREEELRRLTRVLDESLAGIGRLVLISGEPGVGKTRLAVEILDAAGARGARSAVGACWDGAGAPGLWPWVQILRSLRSALGAAGWERAAGSGHGALTRLLDIDERGGAAEFHLFEAMLQFLANVCGERPLVVLLDDLQWSDPASVALVEFLHHHAVHLPFLVVGTYRADEVASLGHPQREPVADLALKAVTIPLTGLDNEGIRQVREQLGAPTSTAEAEHLRRLTGGNPFFVIESVAFTDPTESLGVRRAIDRRVDALGEAERHVLTIASLIGRDVPDALLDAVVGESADAALGAIERSGLMSRNQGQHTFVHDLVRETMRDRLPPNERRGLYAAIVDAADGPSLHGCLMPSQLAWLATQAVPTIAPERAVALLEAAATDATSRVNHEEAARHLEQAAELTSDPDQRAHLTLESGHAYERAGALARARERFAGLGMADNARTRARGLLGLHRVGDPAGAGEPSELVRQLDAIDSELGTVADSALRAEVLAARSRSRAHLQADDRSAASSMAAEALDLARSAGDEATVASCLLAYHDAIWEPGTEHARSKLADELAASGRRRSDASLEAQGLLLRMVAELETGDPAYRATHRQFDAVAVASRLPRLQFVAASRRGMIAALRADLATARAEIDAARALGERIGEPDAAAMWCDQRWQVARHAGDADMLAELLAMLRDMGDPHWMIYEAMVAADLGDVDRARWVKPHLAALGQRWPRWAARLWDTFNVELAIVEHDDTRIADLVERLEHDAGHWAVLGGGVIVDGPICLWLGRLEAARDGWERAVAWSTDAEGAALRLDAQLWAIEARADRLTAQHAVGSADPTELGSAISAAHVRGLRPIVERLQALTPTPRVNTVNVFRRDHDVWTLAFDGVEVRMPDTKGLRDLHTLLANPRTDVPAASLVTDAFVSADVTPVLDAGAKAAYRRRLDDLDSELDRAAVRGDDARVATLEKERQALLDELRRAAGLGGRDRSLNSDRERLRKTVTARIRDTLRRLDDRHPALAAHMRESVHTGAVCVYAPTEPMTWDLGR